MKHRRLNSPRMEKTNTRAQAAHTNGLFSQDSEDYMHAHLMMNMCLDFDFVRRKQKHFFASLK